MPEKELENTEVTQEPEVVEKDTEETVQTQEQKQEEKQTEEKPQMTAEELLDNKQTDGKKTLVDRYIETKSLSKQQAKRIAELEKQVQEGGTKAELEDLSEELAEMASEFPEVDPRFFASLDKVLAKKNAGEAKPKFDADAYIKGELDKMPDFKGIASVDVIKAVASQPANSKKTIPEIIEEIYGNAIPGKRTIERTIPAGGKEPEALDFQRANSGDTKYFSEVMASPKLKEEYNKRMLSRGL